MMNSLFKIVILVLFSSSFSFATAGDPDNLDVRDVASNDVLWMHPTPSSKSKKIEEIPYNERCLKNLGCKEQWCKVNYRDTIGWVNRKFLGESGHCPQSSYSNIQISSNVSLSNTSNYGEYDQLYMQIYGRLDTRIASRRDYLEDINKFIHTAALLLIKKHKLDIKMHKVRQYQMAAVEAPPEVTGLMNALGSMENLDGQTIVDHDGNKLTTMTELKSAYSKAIKKSIQFQRDNYTSEKERESDLAKLKDLLTRSGSSEQKNDMKGTYRYYKKLLDDLPVWCIADKDTSQEKPLFYPKSFIIEHLYQKYETELSRSHNSYDPKVLSSRAKNIEEKSQKIKHQFNRDYLYELRAEPHRIKSKF